jgi:hypothetical protein
LLSVSPALRAQQDPPAAQDVPAPNAESLLREIEAMEGKQKDAKAREKKELLGLVQSATASGVAAANFYERAVEEVDFAGRKDKASAFVDWKKSKADLLRSKEMQTALLLHLKYLSLALQRKGMENPEAMTPALMAYVGELVAADRDFLEQKQKPDEQKKLLEQPLGQSVFAQWLKLGQWLPEDKIWEQRPGDVAGILEKNLRPLFREKKDRQILQTWDIQLKLEADRITQGRSEHQIDKFNSTTRPTLQFKRAQDMVAIGQPNRGLVEMVAVIRANPSHPDFANWLATVRGLLKPADTSPQ